MRPTFVGLPHYARGRTLAFVYMNFNDAIKVFNANRALRVKAGSINGQDKDLRNFAIFMRNCRIEDVTDEHVVEWITLFKTMGYTNNTLIRKEESLIQFYKFWEKKGLDVLRPDLIPLTDKEYTKPRVCTQENYDKLLDVYPIGTDSFKIRNRAMLALMWNTGMRAGELLALNVGDLNMEKKLITIKTEKSKGVRPFRTLPYDTFDSKAVEVLPMWLEIREKIIKAKPVDDPNALFMAYKTTKVRGNRLTNQSLGEIFAKTSKKAGLEVEDYINPHSLRHHFGHALAKMKMPNSVISESMGHSSLNSSLRYTQLDSADLIKMLREG